MAKYLIEYDVQLGTHYYTKEKVTVTATDPGYAKYHWHRHMQNKGHKKQSKNEYNNHRIGARFQLNSIRELNNDDLSDRVLLSEYRAIPGFDELE
jgi:hypothetical protein